VRIGTEDGTVHDSLGLAVSPGGPNAIAFDTPDTAVYVGAGIRVRAAVLDRYGNRRPDPVTVSVRPGSTELVHVTDADSITADKIGRATILASGSGTGQLGYLSVVPVGRLAAIQRARDPAEVHRVIILGTDGSSPRLFNPGPLPLLYETSLAWSPTGGALASHFIDLGGSRLFQFDTAGQMSPLIGLAYQTSSDRFPQYATNGTTIYYVGTPEPSVSRTVLLRLDIPTAVSEQVFAPSPFESNTDPAPSPDGTYLAFVTNRPDFNSSRRDLAVLNLATNEVTLAASAARTPRWSPDGALIAFVREGNLWTAFPDGSQVKQITQGAGIYRPGLSWSPDSHYLLAASDSGLRIVEPATGTVLPLAFTMGWEAPAWHP
jgi:hypothetical protein